MKTTKMLVAAAVSMAAVVLAGVPVVSAEVDQGCNNAGVQTQVSVTGDNSYKCQYQHCVYGGAAGAAGAGVGTGASQGSAAAQATAGQECHQDGGDGGDPGCPPPCSVILLPDGGPMS